MGAERTENVPGWWAGIGRKEKPTSARLVRWFRLKLLQNIIRRLL
ncbi:hypothetical protein [Okeania sp. SIO1I7]|nr:hypothetical protein [Okeania sp. SIO1I7]